MWWFPQHAWVGGCCFYGRHQSLKPPDTAGSRILKVSDQAAEADIFSFQICNIFIFILQEACCKGVGGDMSISHAIGFMLTRYVEVCLINGSRWDNLLKINVMLRHYHLADPMCLCVHMCVCLHSSSNSGKVMFKSLHRKGNKTFPDSVHGFWWWTVSHVYKNTDKSENTSVSRHFGLSPMVQQLSLW